MGVQRGELLEDVEENRWGYRDLFIPVVDEFVILPRISPTRTADDWNLALCICVCHGGQKKTSLYPTEKLFRVCLSFVFFYLYVFDLLNCRETTYSA